MDLYSFVPWISFVAGFTGSLHCIGMCGGLVASCSSTNSGLYAYQLGRFLGYSLLGLIAGSIGHFLGLQFTSKGPGLWASGLTSFFMGSLLIYWGVKSYLGTQIEIPVPKTFKRLQMNLWQKAINKLEGGIKGFSIGLLSIFLPCGLLYGTVVSIASFQSPLVGTFSMMSFWLGTLPALLGAGTIFKKILMPIKHSFPKAASLLLVLIGILTISWRIFKITNQLSGESCH